MSLRNESTLDRIQRFMRTLGEEVRGSGKVYFTGGVSAVLMEWREMTVDIDLAADPEPEGFFEALPAIKDRLDINLKLARPSDFVPVLPGWQERSLFIERQGAVDFLHYDFYSQALAKIERWHGRDRIDVQRMMDDHLVDRKRLWELFEAIRPALIRYPAIDPQAFESKVQEIGEKTAPPL